jgi:hypothetical protein
MVRVKSQKHFYLDGLFDTLNEGISQLDRDKIKSLRQVSADARELMMDILDGLVIEVPTPVLVEPSIQQSVAIDSVVIEDVNPTIKNPIKRNRSKKVVDNG